MRYQEVPMVSSKKPIQLLAVGDVHPNRQRPESLFEQVGDQLRGADITYCQLEAAVSDKGVLRTDVRNPAHRVPPEMVRALTFAGFDVVSFAGNNNLDYGIEAFLDTIDRLKSHGIEVIGAGRNLEEAQRPVILEREGIKVAFINHCSMLRDGYEATPERPGIAPLRVKTFYEPLENINEQPGTPAKTITIPDEDDLRTVVQLIREAKASADIVVACFHWGIHFTYDLAMYQPVVAYAAIDAGADLVLGTHPHCLQAIDVYKGKVICYSLSNFAFEMPESIAKRGVSEYLSFYGLSMDDEVPTHPHPDHCRRSMILKVAIEQGQIQRVSFVPTIFSTRAQPEILSPDSDEFHNIVNLMTDLSRDLGTELKLENGEVVISTQKTEAIDTRDLLRRRKVSYPSLLRLARDF